MQTEVSAATVLDNLQFLAGTISGVTGGTPEDPNVISISTRAPNGSLIEVTLEEGLPQLFDGVAVADYVMCAFLPHQANGEMSVRGVCYWLVGQPKGVVAVNRADFLFQQLKTATGKCKHLVKDVKVGEQFLERGAALVGAKLEVEDAACLIAALKAMRSCEFFLLATKLLIDGYFPVGYECCSNMANSGYAGYINVVFRFRNSIHDERMIVVPVKLNTWHAAAGMNSSVGEVREIDPSSNPCTVTRLTSDCIEVTIANGQASLNVPYAGSISISVKDWVPNGTIARACFDVCKKYGIPCGVEVWVDALGQRVGQQSWGCC